MELHLVRHPQPQVTPGQCYGSTDLAPNAEDTERVLAGLACAGLPGDMPVYASPLVRCAILARGLSAQPLFDARLAEMDFGAWEMQHWDSIPRSEIDAWSADLLHYRPGGGESVMDVAMRVAAFKADLDARCHPRVFVICHAGAMRLLSSLHAGGTLEQAALRAAQTPHRIGYGEVLLLQD